MKILGIGVDIVENSRIGNLLKDKLFIKASFLFKNYVVGSME